MELALPTLASILRPPGALPLVRQPNRRWSRGASASLRTLRVAEVLAETPTTKTFVFEDAGLVYVAGQHLTVVAEIDGRSHRRCYSFSTSPLGGGRPAITVKRVEGGRLSNWLHDTIAPGDTIRALPPSGSFTLPKDPRASRHVVMVAGGVGITPLVSLAETLLREESGARVTLLYGSRSPEEIIFRSRLDAIARAFPRRFDVVLTVDEAGAEWNALTGPLGGQRVLSLVRDVVASSWFVCGPGPMMDSLVAALDEAGVPASNVHLERFQYAEAGAATAPSTPATLVLAKSGSTITARVGSTLLEAAEEAGIPVPSSCRMGGCGACKIRVDGRVVSAEPNCLSAEEKGQGYALACCSWGDGRVVLRDY